MRGHSRTLQEKVAAIAGRAHGVVTRAELLETGLSSTGVERWLKKGLLITQYPGVYRVGHAAPSIAASFMAAVKACGPGAVLSGLAAAYLLGLVKKPPRVPEVTAPTERRIKGIKTKRRRLKPNEITRVNGIPVTNAARTLVDLASELTLDDLARACHEAGVRHRTTPRNVAALVARTTPGRRNLRLVMTGDAHVTLSELERAFLKLLRAGGLPLPVTNKLVGSKRVDCHWPELGVTVELVSYRFHNSYYSWEQDQRRRREARARGDEFRTYTWSDITDDAAAVVAELRELLSPGCAPRSASAL
jgi:hypothetical protein